MKVVVLCAMWKRHEVFKIWANNIKQLGVDVVVVGSEGAISKNLCNDFDYVEYKNKPLSNKWNAGLSHLLKNHQFDYVLILGSDDIVTPNYIDLFSNHLINGMTGRTDSFQFNLITKKCGYFSGYKNYRRGETVGAGRFIDIKTIKKLNGALWDDGLNMSLDFSMVTKMKKAKIPIKGVQIKDMGVIGMGIKGKLNMNKFNPHRFVDPSSILKQFDSQTQKMISKF